jgi:4-hydroxybenzoyl-CoA thioesterase
MGRLRSRRDHFLSALFRDVRHVDDRSARARARHEKIEYLKAYAFAGHPLVETRARFRLPTRFGDDVAIETGVVECGRSSFKIEHRLTQGGVLAVEGFETRVWVVRDPDDPALIKSQPIPPEVRRAF